MTTRPIARPPEAAVRCDDIFTDDRRPGSVVGSSGPLAAERLGVDAESKISIDNGALRMEPLVECGWGREAIAYGPFAAEPGLAFVAHVLNGHNASQTFYFPESARERVRRWLADARRGQFKRPHHYENLAVGFLDDPASTDPMQRSHALIMHAATEDNGELWSTDAGRRVRIVRGVLNIPFLFVVVFRVDGGAAYYAASLSDVPGGGSYPMLRPLGISSASDSSRPWYATIQQRILGEVGYNVSTRVYGTRVAQVPEWAGSWGSAMLADRFVGQGPVVGSGAALGGSWRALDGRPSSIRSASGARSPLAEETGGLLTSDRPVGLIRAVVAAGRTGQVELRWRVGDGSAGAAIRLGPGSCQVVDLRVDGAPQVLVSDPSRGLRRGATHVVQLLDDGRQVAVHVDGQLVGERWLPVDADEPSDVGFSVSGDMHLSSIEVHPRQIPIPSQLDLGSPWRPPESRIVFDEQFDTERDDIDGVSTPSGGRLWERSEGPGGIVLRGAGDARVRADRETPNPDRTIFTVPWDEPDFADVMVDMTQPGQARGEGENGRVGMVFWQDADNYLVVNVFVDDVFDGASISTFYHLDGYENMYDAVWTLVRGVEWGGRCSLRAAFDGMTFLAWANDEPALVRSLTDVYPDAAPLRIERVGLIVNEEWGNDTGTVIHRFTAAGRADRPPAPQDPSV